ncbi:hypothetical protein [Sandaracinus amylolyticus]|uniref:hypothetical protein n=1 Tax=Sandaracinus amylolyticus TaxID=927083 RepID=UPI001F1A7435|nr:hypothetical protein [Sandaracinus amylolyticus]UJR85613.1 Hypothetical protein I5071_76930 [Sandaracinus amylolyticus]
MRTTIVLSVVFTLAIAPLVRAQSPVECAPTERTDRLRLLRQLSLDLRGRIPSEAEYEAIRAHDDVPEDVLAAMLTSDDFFATMREYHRGILWSSLIEIDDLVDNRRDLRAQRVGANNVYYSGNAAGTFRGTGQVSCVDVEHTRFDAAGHALPIVEGYRSGTVSGAPAPRNAARCAAATNGCRIDGWVRVRPYWAPDTEIRVCAFDAQTAATGLTTTAGAPTSCRAGIVRDAGCGCGPNLRQCVSGGTGGSEQTIARALEQEPLRIFDRVLRDPDASYFDAFTTTTSEVNGPIAHYFRYASAGVVEDGSMATTMPDVEFGDTTWRAVERSPEHAGVLTTFSYLLRFASHRARANRFTTAFLCEPFQAPSGGLPPATDACSSDPNLSTRCGCESCHERLEPMAAHWGRWRFNGDYGFVNVAQLPRFNETCANCREGACSAFCDEFYVTRDTSSHPMEREMWLGTLQVVAWRSEGEANAIDVGPRALIEQEGTIERMATCSARTLAEHLLHRELTSDEQLEWVPELAQAFAESGYRFPELVSAIVTDTRYRAIR